MAQWKERINISALTRLYEKGTIGLNRLGKGVATKLRKTAYHIDHNEDMLTIICQFAELTDTHTLKDYEGVLDMLYDFGDEERKLWIETEKIEEATTDEDDRAPILTGGSGSNYAGSGSNSSFKSHSHYPPGHTSTGYHSSSSQSSSFSRSDRSKGSWDNNTPSLTTLELDKKFQEFGIAREKVSYDLCEYIRKAPEESKEWLLKLLPMPRKLIERHEEDNGQQSNAQ